MYQSQRRIGFGEQLRHYRARAGLTQEQLAERAGLSRRGIADLERGARRVPYDHTTERLARALDLSPAERSALFDARRGFLRSGTPAQGHDGSVALQPFPQKNV